jgi:hypothetical protein
VTDRMLEMFRRPRVRAAADDEAKP